jgi:glycosyltransferase involved in cell wall biosynthesis
MVDLCVGLLDRGVDLAVVTLDPEVREEVVLRGPRWKLIVGPYRSAHRARDGFRHERDFVRRALQRERPDVIHALWTYEFALGALAADERAVITVHDWAPTIFRYMPDPYRFVRLLMQRSVLRIGRNFIANSPYIQERLRSRTGVSHPIVPNPVAVDHFHWEARRRRRDAPRIVAINHGFSKHKNVKSLLRAFRIIRSGRPDAQLLLIGNDFEPGGSAARWAAAHCLDGNVRFLGSAPNAEVLAQLARADLLVHASLEESFGMVVAEAMATRTPVIGGERSGAVPWVLGHGGAGLLVDVTSPGQIADAALRVLADDGLWQRLSASGFQHAWENFRSPVVAERHLAVYRHVLDDAGAPARLAAPAR